MTDLRTAAQQALQALAIGQDAAHEVAQTYHEAMAGYRPARHIAVDDDVRKIEDAITALRAALAEPVEPVAWRFKAMIGMPWSLSDDGYYISCKRDQRYFVEALYTAPPQRKPLTEEEIDSIWDSEKAFADIYAIARAIERAHGIDGAPEERHFCSRCGKRSTGIHTCTPPVPLTDEVIAELWHQNGGFHHHFARAIERWLRGHA